MNWINASKQLPSDYERVLLYTPYPFFGEDHACVGDKESIKACTAKINKEKVPIFTHWMPLPPEPEQKA